jgi:uncharacterized radical SAM superfamily Fe-S cluster-containing enzyme
VIENKNMTAKILKHTKSLSPITLKTIDAKIFFDGEDVYMMKKDEEGKEYKTLIEKDKALYLLLTKLAGGISVKTKFISTYASAKCNLNCQVCYEKSGHNKEISLEEIKELSEKYRRCRMGVTGMEPTCREDIFDLMEIVRNNHSLVTNGIKLASLEYVRQLEKHGLKRLCFSFNGLNDEIYRKINGENLLEIKLEALKNIELEKIDTLLSTTIAKGINEDQILPLVEFCFEHRSVIIGLRMRTMVHTGKHLNAEQICMSELIELVANALNINKTDIITEFCFIQAFIENYSNILPQGFKDHYGAKLCSFIFNVKKKTTGKYYSPGMYINMKRINKSTFRSAYLFYYLFKAYGLSLLLETVLHVLNLRRFVVQNKILNISLKCWPNLYNIDLEEMDKCPHVYYRNGEMEKFCVSNIKNSMKI